MANSNGGNDIDPLLQHLISPTINPPLSPLPEHKDVTIPMPMTPSEFKDRLIFGSSSGTTSFTESSTLDNFFPPPNLRARKPESSHNGFYRSKSAPAISEINDLTHTIDQKTEQSDSKSIVRQAIALLILYLSLGMFIFWLKRDSYLINHTVDNLYFYIVTICTLGYGDTTPDSVLTKLVSILFVLIGFVLMAKLLSGMVTYVLDLQENYKNDSFDEPKRHIINVKKGSMRIKLKLGLALGVLMLSLGFGVLIMHFVEKIGWLDSFYYSVMPVTTIGYKDQAFKTLTGRLLASIWLLVSTLSVVQVCLCLVEAIVDKRNKDRVKRVLDETMSISEFLAADINNNGCP